MRGQITFVLSHLIGNFNRYASLYSLVETARANGLEPYAYLKMIMTELPAAKLLEDIERLLPFNQSDSWDRSYFKHLSKVYNIHGLLKHLNYKGNIFCEKSR